MGCMIFELCYIMLEVIGTVGIMRKLYSGHVGIFMLTWWSILFFFPCGECSGHNCSYVWCFAGPYFMYLVH